MWHVRFKIENLMLLFMLEYHRVTSMVIKSKFKSGKLFYVQTNDERFKFCSFLEKKINKFCSIPNGREKINREID